MPPVSYSAPPSQPELLSSNPFYNTILSYMLFGAAKGLPRDCVHNSIPRGYMGKFGNSCGEWPKVIAGGFPYAPAADGSATGYSLRFTGGSRSLDYPLSGFQTPTWHQTVGGVSGTIYCVFKIEEAFGFGQAVAILVQNNPSPFTTGGITPSVGNGGTLLGALNPGIGLCVASDPIGNMYFGYSEDQTFPKSYYVTTAAPVLKNTWYLGAVSWYNGTDTYSTSIVNPRRVYLWNLATNTQICGAAAQTSQTFANPCGSSAAPGINKGYAGTQSNLPAAANYDLVIAPGADPAVNNAGHLCGQIHMVMSDQTFVDNTGQFAAIPAAFSGVDAFTTLVADIYAPIRGTYATGSGGTTLVNSSTQTITGGNVYAQIGMPKLAGDYTTIANALAGVPSDLGIMFIGDISVTNITNTSVQITVSRPQAAAAAITQYVLYGSLTSPFTPGAGNLLATQTVAGDPITANVFNYTPPDAQPRFYKVIATDASSNTYAYASTPATALKAGPAIALATCGNSYETPTGSSPWQHFVRAAQSWGIDVPVWVTGYDGSTVANWTSGQALLATPFETATYNPLSWLQSILAREATALGRAIDLCICWLIENNTVGGETSSAFNTSMQTMQAALTGSNLVKFAPLPYGNRILAGGNDQSSSASQSNGNGIAIGQGLPTIDNGTSLVVLGANSTDPGSWAAITGSFPFDMVGIHPGPFISEIEAMIYVRKYMNRFVFPTYKVIGG